VVLVGTTVRPGGRSLGRLSWSRRVPVGTDGCGADVGAGGWAAYAGQHHSACPGLCGCFRQYPGTPGALFLVLSLSLVLAGADGVWGLSQVGGPLDR
jgi:hypothetical protein